MYVTQRMKFLTTNWQYVYGAQVQKQRDNEANFVSFVRVASDWSQLEEVDQREKEETKTK